MMIIIIICGKAGLAKLLIFRVSQL